MSKIKTPVTSNLGIIGTLSPYSYQVKPKVARDLITVNFDNNEYQGRLTSGQGKGAVPRFYAYFMQGDFQHWIELTEAAHKELKVNKAATLNLFTVVAGTGDAPKADAPKAPAKGKRAKREQAAAEQATAE
jgi:hypothetical protein